MPLLHFYTSPNQLSQVEKQELASTLTDRYARIMPDFFVNVIFHEIPNGSFFVAGKPTDGKFVRLTVEHIAVNWKKDAKRERAYLDWLGGVLGERWERRGWMWEFNVAESDRDLWLIQSLVPPEIGSEAMKSWVQAGKGIPWEKVDERL